MKIILSLLFIIVTYLNAQTISIAVASNVSYAIDELKSEFLKTHPDIKVQVILGSSGKLTAQIKNGAPYGIFISANMQYPEALYSEKIAITKPLVYAKGTLAYLSIHKQNFSKGINLLKERSIKRIAIANPKTAPYGLATEEALKKAKVYATLKSKFIYGESITQTLTYTLRAADIGIVAKSLLYNPKMAQYKEGINWIEVKSKLYTPIKQGIVLLKFSKNIKAYRDFYDFIFSQEAKKIFKKYGYIIS